MTLKQFFFLYPSITDSKFETTLSSKWEFRENTLEEKKNYKLEIGTLLPYQKTIARFLAHETPYNGLLLVHKMGLGKTCAAIGMIENNKTKYSGALIFASGDNLLKNFQRELVFSCTAGDYIPDNFESLTENEKTVRINKKTSYYSLNTFEKFARTLESQSDSDIKIMYSKKIWVIDEAHGLIHADLKGAYQQFWRALHIVENVKILLLTGTPMQDNATEIAPILNLILPADQQLQQGNAFINNYLTPEGFARENLKSIMRGRVSFLKPSYDIKKKFQGDKFGNLKFFDVVVDFMSKYQSETYSRAYRQDNASDKGLGINSNARQASLAVFPDGMWGSAGSEVFIDQKTLTLTSDAKKKIGPATLDNLNIYSSKYAALFKSISEAEKNNENVFVYCSFVRGSGIIYLTALLKYFGWSQATGNETTPGKRFALLSSISATPNKIAQLVARFNNPDNVDGKYIRVIIGSEIIALGFTFKNIQRCEILTPHWNYHETAQAIARGFRTGSHTELLKKNNNIVYKIYQRVSIPSTTQSIDLKIYEIAEDKEIKIQYVERAIEESSFDCVINRAQNYTPGYDYQLDCQFLPCEYTCFGNDNQVTDYSSYDLLYAAPVMKDIRRRVISLFESQTSFATFNELKKYINPYSDYELLNVLEEIIDSGYIFREKTQLFSHRGFFYLGQDESKFIYDTVYFDTPFLIQDVDEREIYDGEIKRVVPNLIRRFFKEQNEVVVKTIFYKFPQSITIKIFEQCVIASTKNIPLKFAGKWVINYYKNFSKRIDSGFIHWIDDIRFLSEGASKWIDAPEEIKLSVKKMLKKEQLRLENNPYQKYGQYSQTPSAKNNFCIRDVSVIEDKKHKRTSGKRCANWDRDKLLTAAIDEFKIKLPLDAGPDKKLLKNILEMNIEELRSKVKNLSEFKYEKNVNNSSEEELRRAAFFGYISVTRLCDYIEEWFDQQNLLVEDPGCGNQSKQKI